MTELLDLIRLTMVPGVGPQTSRALLEQFGTAGRVLSATPVASCASVAGVGPKLAEKIARARREFDAEAELALCRRADVRRHRARRSGVSRRRSQNIPDPPGLLYVQGTARAARPARHRAGRLAALHALRGADRRAAGGRRWRGSGFTVVSGLARGIDAAAHRGALKAGGRTIAVLANGLASVYPPEHEDLARGSPRPAAWSARCRCGRSAGRPLPPAQSDHLRPLPGRGRRRGDAAERLALDGAARDGAEPRGLRRPRAGRQPRQPRLPSPDPRRCPARRDRRRHPRRARPAGPRGPHRPRRAAGPASRPSWPSPISERSLLGQLDDHPTGVDELIVRTGLTAAQVMATLSVLEMKRLVRRLPGHRFVRA